MTEKLIDVWDSETFDDALLGDLRAAAAVVRDYMAAEKRIDLEYQTARKSKWQPRQSNSYASEYQDLVEGTIAPAMNKRTIRAWHYTRLTDSEAALLRTDGIYISTLKTIRMRLDNQIAAGSLSAKTADALYAASPFHEQHDVRSNRFWMTSHPSPIDDSGVTELLGKWGGEGVSFPRQDVEQIDSLEGIGRPRVIEIALPLNATNRACAAAQAVVASFGRTLGCEPDPAAFDLYSTRNLCPATVLNILTEGDPNFERLARGHPISFICPTTSADIASV